MPSTPGTVVVVDAAASPVPSPTTPTPGMVIGDKSADTDAYTEGDQRCCDNGARSWPDVDDRWIVLRHVDNLWVGGLNDICGLTGGLLHLDLLLLIAAQGSRRIGLRAQPLDGRCDFGLIGGNRLPDRCVVIDVLRHHFEHRRKRDQRDECRVKSLCLGTIGESSASEALVVDEPVVDVENFLGIG
jgi:hypothetical protein